MTRKLYSHKPRVPITAEQRRWIRRAAKAGGISKAQVVRDAIAAAMRKNKRISA